MRQKDIERLAAIALSANAGDEALVCKMAARLWRVRRWAAEQTWRAGAVTETARRELLERVSNSVDGALQALAGLQALEDAGPAAAPEAAPAVIPPVAVAAPEERVQDTAEQLGAESTEEKVALMTGVLKSGAKA